MDGTTNNRIKMRIDDVSPLKSFLFHASVVVGGGGFVFGYDIGVISGTLPVIKNEFDLDPLKVPVVMSVSYDGSTYTRKYCMLTYIYIYDHLGR